MASPLITAIRQRRDLKESLTHTAQELAHLASIYGVVRVSYSYLAVKCRCSRRTAMRHVQRLLDLGIIGKTVLWIRGNFCEINTYTALQHCSCDRTSFGGSASTRSFSFYLWHWQSAMQMARKTGDTASMSRKSCRFLAKWETSPGHHGDHGAA